LHQTAGFRTPLPIQAGWGGEHEGINDERNHLRAAVFAPRRVMCAAALAALTQIKSTAPRRRADGTIRAWSAYQFCRAARRSRSPRPAGKTQASAALMGFVEDVKKLAERATGIGLPACGAIESAVRTRRPQRYRFAPAGLIPNHPRWPLIHYRSPVRFLDNAGGAASAAAGQCPSG